MRKLIEKKINTRTEKIVNTFDEFINQGEKVLDIGAGGGWIAKELEKRKKVKITLLDVTNFNQTDLKIVLYDGENIPFSDNHFDTALLIFTLHHCLAPPESFKRSQKSYQKENHCY